MRFQRQGLGECLPACAAMLLNRPLAEILEYCLDGTGLQSWMEALYFTSNRAPVERLLALIPFFPPSLMCGVVPAGDTRLPPGRGIILICFPGSRHAMPYEDGMILDPDGPGKPESLEEVLGRYPGYRVECVVPETK